MVNSSGERGQDTRPVGAPGLDGGSAGADNVLSALFDNYDAAAAAIKELRDIGVPAGNISVIARNEDQGTEPQIGGAAGIAREEVDEEALTYRASQELPHDEELPTTMTQMTGSPRDTDARDGLTREAEMVRRNDADSNADVDIYTDFPDQPGGVNPDSPAAEQAQATQQAPMENRTGSGGAAAVGAGLGGVAGLLIGLGALAVPGVGPLLAAGPLATALGGLLAGGAAGGLVGALSTVGVPQEYARKYAAAIEQGSALVSVRTDTYTHDAVERVLTAHGGKEIH
ncbi:MAG TPA: hypothetical protein VFR15_18010 [Chloroflexia bacterium]|nr:hypothetical protein [Chloroflexia bacterium]